MKKLIGIAAGLGMLLSTVAPALAADCSISTSGPFSRNFCRVRTPKTALYFQDNHALVIKDQTSEANSGGNNSDLNTDVTGGGIETGDADSLIDPPVLVDGNGLIAAPVTDVNSTGVAVDQSAGDDPTTDGSIETSGPFSKNAVSINNSKTALVGIHNSAFVIVKQKSSANTGGNSMSLNTSTSGQITTGNASSSTTSNMYVNYTDVQITQ